MPSVVSCIKREMRNHSVMVQNTLNGKLNELSKRQDRPLLNGSHSNVVIMNGRELPKFVLDILSLGPKHPERDKFNEVHFLADVDKLVRELRENNTEGEKLCEIEASAKWYAKNVRETPLDRGVKKVHDYLKANDLLAVPFDKGCGFCVMKESTYREKLDEVLNSDQFQKIDGAKDQLVIKNEKQINNSLEQLMKQGKIGDKIYQRLRSTGSQPASLYGLAKVHKKDTPLRPVISIPGRSYAKLNRFLTPCLQKLPRANIETNTQDARKALKSLTLENGEQIVSLDVKSLYTNVPVEEAIEIALRKLYSNNLAPDNPRSAMKSLLKLAVTNVHFKCNGIWYVQSDGLAMGASLVVILANVWMKSFEASLQKPELSENFSRSDQNGKCKDCNRRVTYRGKWVECESFKNWSHARCQKISNEEYANMQDVVWLCAYRSNQQTVGHDKEMKLFKKYVDDIICTIRDDPDEYLKFARSLHNNLQYTLEKVNMDGDLAFLDINVNVSSKINITCHCYQKPTDTGIILNFRSCAALQHKKNVIQGAVHRVFNATSNWLSFDQALEKNKSCWTKNQYPKEWSSKIVNQTQKKIISVGKDQLRTTPKEHQKSKTKSIDKPTIFLQYRGNLSQNFASKLKKLCELQVTFTMRKIISCLPTVKSSFDRDLKAHVVYEIICNGCGSIYVGQTSRHVTTRITEHQKKDSRVGQHLVECRGATNDIEWKILDACRTVEKLKIIGAIYISKLKPALNTRDEYRGRELTLKY